MVRSSTAADRAHSFPRTGEIRRGMTNMDNITLLIAHALRQKGLYKQLLQASGWPCFPVCFYVEHRIGHLPVVYQHAHKMHHYLHDSTAFDAHIYGSGMNEEFFWILAETLPCLLAPSFFFPYFLNFDTLYSSWTNKSCHTRTADEKEYGFCDEANFHADHHTLHRANFGSSQGILLDVYFGTAGANTRGAAGLTYERKEHPSDPEKFVIRIERAEGSLRVASAAAAPAVTQDNVDEHTLASSERVVSQAELESKTTEEEGIWIAIDGDVLDVTAFHKRHPGGSDILLQYAGADATSIFKEVGHSQKAKAMALKRRIGRLKAAGAETTSGTARERVQAQVTHGSNFRRRAPTARLASRTSKHARRFALICHQGIWPEVAVEGLRDFPELNGKTRNRGRSLQPFATHNWFLCRGGRLVGMSSMLGSLFGSVCSVDITFDTEANRKSAPLGRDKKGERAYIFTDGEDVMGTAVVSIRPGKKMDHQGIKVELIGQVDMLHDKSQSYDFFSITKDLEPPGALYESKQYKWKFGAVDKQNETYSGINVRLRYFVRLVVLRSYAVNISKEVDMIVQNVYPPPELNNNIKMEVGIEECLHIEFEYDKSKYHLKDVIIGKVYFLLVRIKIKHMELNIIRRESTGTGGSGQQTDNETLTKFEIMDGAPVKDQCIPVRLYLTGFDLTPTYKNVQNKFSVRYFLNLVLVDEEDRRYFKQQEVFLWRKKVG
ncbi:Vacuolar protein sorting-associated protein 26 [Symbiodinium microadriaticum]|uniref:Vacuolar protein sorting-associated protein 26 n=1 Tax=Symbiodinium microadriaticum TaxID=2951 RepID=A0A1Q9DQ90_SYMMI|nr:Vacuolar protein sorting-associated protein 26 [Symbiodinium microadriaticum]